MTRDDTDRRLTVGSLFSGIGGIELGLERTGGFRTIWQVEKDEYARRVLAKHWPNVARFSDVRYFLGSKRWRRCRAAFYVDLVCGGFPCQDISNAGRREGITGERSGLWSEFARIVRLLRPSYVLVENVDALAVRGLGTVLGDLAALGYDAEWDRIPACAVGAPHLRWRIFILAYAKSVQRTPIIRGEQNGAGQPLAADSTINGRHEGRTDHAAQGQGRRIADRGVVGAAVPNTDGERRKECGIHEVTRTHIPDASRSGRSRTDVSLAESRWAGQRWREQFAAFCEGTRNVYWPDTEPPVCGVADGVPARVDRLRGLGNAVVPQVAEWIGRRILEAVLQ